MQANLRKVVTVKNTFVNYVMLAAVLAHIGMGIYIITTDLPLFFLKIPGFTLAGSVLIFLVYRLVAHR